MFSYKISLVREPSVTYHFEIFQEKQIHHVGYIPGICLSNHRLPSCLYSLHLSRKEKCYNSSRDGRVR